jgi:hypothetical protein
LRGPAQARSGKELGHDAQPSERLRLLRWLVLIDSLAAFRRFLLQIGGANIAGVDR